MKHLNLSFSVSSQSKVVLRFIKKGKFGVLTHAKTLRIEYLIQLNKRPSLNTQIHI